MRVRRVRGCECKGVERTGAEREGTEHEDIEREGKLHKGAGCEDVSTLPKRIITANLDRSQHQYVEIQAE